MIIKNLTLVNGDRYFECKTFVKWLAYKHGIVETKAGKEYIEFCTVEICNIGKIPVIQLYIRPTGFQKFSGGDGISTYKFKGDIYFKITDMLSTMSDHFNKSRNDDEKTLIHQMASEMAQHAGDNVKVVINETKILDAN